MIYSIGEALIDIYEAEAGNIKHAGGASAAFCSAVTSLGGNAALITKLGADYDGDYLLRCIQHAQINTDYVFIDSNHKTGNVMISPSGSSLCRLRRDAADMFLDSGSIPEGLFRKDDLLHFCSMGLLESPAKYAHIKAIKESSKVGAIIAFDINYRPKQWQSAEECLKAIAAVFNDIDYIKVSKEELEMLFPAVSNETVAKTMLEHSNKLKCVIITRGNGPSTAYFKEAQPISVSPYIAHTVDATGAGDCFFGAFLLNMQQLNGFWAVGDAYAMCVLKSLNYASVAAALSSEQLGAFCLIKHEEVEKRLRSVEPI